MVERSGRAVGGMRAVGRRGVMLVAIAVLLPALVGVAVAFAVDKGQVDGFGSQGTAPGQFSGSGLRDVAVNQDSGRVYVVDAAANRFVGNPSLINVFAADGEFVSRFGRSGEDKGEFAPTGGSSGPQGLAVEPDGSSLYVTEPRHTPEGFGPLLAGARVQKFSAVGEFESVGEFELMWGWGVATGAEQFEVCDAAAESCQSGIPGSGAGQLGSSSASARVAVSPVAPHHVFVADPANRRVQEFEPDGDFVRALGWGVDDGDEEFQTCTATSGCQAGLTTAGSEPGRFAARQPVHLAVDGDGVLYASDSVDGNRVQRLDTTAGADADIPMAPIGGTGSPLLAGVTAGLAVDPSSGSLLVARDPSSGETVVEELGAPGGSVPGVDFTHGVGEGFTTVNGIDVNGTTGDLYVSRSNVSQVSVLNIGSEPELVVDAPSDVEATTATFTGTVDPNGSRTFYRFEYRQASDSSFESVPVPDAVIPRGVDSQVAVSESVTGLAPGADYELRLRADGWGAPVQTALREFSVPRSAPVVTPLPAAAAHDSALLAARINPSNEQTDYRFEYRAAAGFDPADPDRWDGATRAPVPDGGLPAGIDDVVVTERIDGLEPQTDYRFRLVASNETGTATGVDRQLTTLPAPDDVGPSDQPRAFELVSPADKISGRGLGYWYTSPASTGDAGFAAYVGERFAAQSRLGAPLLDGEFGFENDYAFADRVGNEVGWQSHSPLTHAAHEAQTAKVAGIGSATADISRLAWTSNNTTIGIFPETIDGGVRWTGGNGIVPSFVSDWGGAKPPAGSTTRWEIFGPTIADATVQTEEPGGSEDRSQCHIAFAGDGSSAVCSTDGHNAIGASTMFGLAGPGDPTWRRPPDPDAPLGRVIYEADVSGRLADSFAGTGPRRLVNVCADGTELPSVDADGSLGADACPAPIGDDDVRLVSGHGATIQRSQIGAASGRWRNSERNVVSEDGSRVFFMSPDPNVAGVPNGTSAFCENPGDLCPTQLYVRQRNGDGSIATRWISKAEEGLFGDQRATLTGTVFFEGATPDGSRVFFRTNQPLTADDPNGQPVDPVDPRPIVAGTPSNDSWDLYMYELPAGPDGDPGEGELTRISAGPDGDGDCNSPLEATDSVGALRFASDDGDRLYFTCQAPLGDVGAPDNGTITSPAGTPTTADRTNLYLYDASLPAEQRWRFVARLPRSTGSGAANLIDACATTGNDPTSPLRHAQQNTGRFGVILASNCVRGTSNGGFVTFWTLGRLTADDPDESSADIYAYDADGDELVRITRRQDGVDEVPYPCGNDGDSATIDCHGDGGIDQGPNPSLTVATDPLVEGDRVAFFQSRSQLVAEDGDDAYDVYMWRNGELSLLTPGDSDTDGAFYKGNDVSGRNVYFVTRDSMSWQDHDAVLDAYTARVDGGIPQPPEPDLCGVLGGGCHGGGTELGVVGVESTRPGGGDASPGVRPRLALGRIGAKARRRAARRGVLVLRVRTNRPGRIVAAARGRVRARGGRVRVRRVAFSRVRVERAGRVVVRLRLARVARRQLRRGGRLPLRVRVARPGAHPRSTAVLLRRSRR